VRWGLVIGALVALLWASEARAGTYDVYGCRLPDGTPIAARGWTEFGWGGSRTDGCSFRGALTASLDPAASISEGTRIGWEFNAPTDTEISGYVLYRSSVGEAVGYRNRAALIYHDAPIFDGAAQRYTQELCMVYVMGCAARGDASYPLAPANRFTRSRVQVRRIIVANECFIAAEAQDRTCPPASGSAPNVAVYASQIAIQDALEPVFSVAPSGALLDMANPVDGRRAASYVAEDRGGGIATVAVVVDGVIATEQEADPSAADCKQPYRTPVPCPLFAKGTIDFDTTSIANGAHQVALAVSDAAGNRTTSAPVTITVRNPGAANGARASRFAHLEAWFETKGSKHRAAATVGYGRTRAVVGRLTDESGAPISDAVLDLTATAARPGASIRALGQIATDRDGRFRFLPRSGSSRRLTIGYRAFHLDEAPSATATLGLQVRAGLTLSVRPRRVSSRGTIRFDGRLRGGPGRAGTQVVIDALGGRRDRIPVATVRANAKGRFHYRYRFRNSAPGVTYRFQATMHAQRSYPYATGSSRTATVRIR
jgi:hypothetical protein